MGIAAAVFVAAPAATAEAEVLASPGSAGSAVAASVTTLAWSQPTTSGTRVTVRDPVGRREIKLQPVSSGYDFSLGISFDGRMNLVYSRCIDAYQRAYSGVLGHVVAQNCHLFAASTSTGQEVQLPIERSHEVAFGRPSLFGDRIAYVVQTTSYDAHPRQEIEVHDFATAKDMRITVPRFASCASTVSPVPGTPTYDCGDGASNLSMSGSYLAYRWQATTQVTSCAMRTPLEPGLTCPSAYRSQIRLVDLRTRKTSVLETLEGARPYGVKPYSTTTLVGPSKWGPHVYWQKSTTGGHLRQYDVRDHRRVMLPGFAFESPGLVPAALAESRGTLIAFGVVANRKQACGQTNQQTEGPDGSINGRCAVEVHGRIGVSRATRGGRMGR